MQSSPCNSHVLFSSICCLFKISRSRDLVFPIQYYKLRRAIRNKQLEFQIEMMALLRNALFLHSASVFVNVMISSSGLLSLCHLMGAEDCMIYLVFVSQFDNNFRKNILQPLQQIRQIVHNLVMQIAMTLAFLYISKS